MIQPSLRKLLGAFCLALLVLALAGCGRRGPPELPPDAAAPANAQTNGNQQAAGSPTTQSPTTQGPNPIGTAPVGPSLDSTMTQNPTSVQNGAPKPSSSVFSSFPLDPLLK